jgi:drug/metabolite transporter (DMT)-like permease
MTGSKKQLDAGQQFAVGVVGIVQAAFAFLAFWDLWHRDAREVKWSKPAWIPIILVNWIGPAAYFLFGIKR